MHVVIDATGLKVYGAGEWLVEKHDERGARTWRKLHLAVNPSTGEILASELTSNEEGDASQVGPLLGQIPGSLASVTADGAYDGEPVYRAVSERQPDPPVAVVIPPRSTAVPSTTAGTTPSQRNGHIQMIADKGRMAWQKTTGYGRRSNADVVHTKAAKPAMGQVEVQPGAELPLGADAAEVANQQHAYHQLRIDRGTPDQAVVGRHDAPDERRVQQCVHRTKQVVGWKVVINPDRRKHRLRHDPLAHHHRLHRTMETNESQPLAPSKRKLQCLFQQHQVFSDSPIKRSGQRRTLQVSGPTGASGQSFQLYRPMRVKAHQRFWP